MLYYKQLQLKLKSPQGSPCQQNGKKTLFTGKFGTKNIFQCSWKNT